MDRVRDKVISVIIKTDTDVPEIEVQGNGIQNVIRQILIGSDDGITDIVMRKFRILPRGNTPFHRHEHEHVVKIEKGKGIVVDENSQEYLVHVGQSLLIEGGEKHQFKNPYEEPFEFLCIIKDLKKSARSD